MFDRGWRGGLRVPMHIAAMRNETTGCGESTRAKAAKPSHLSVYRKAEDEEMASLSACGLTILIPLRLANGRVARIAHPRLFLSPTMARKTKKVHSHETGCTSAAGGGKPEPSLQIRDGPTANADDAEMDDRGKEDPLAPMADPTHLQEVSTAYSRTQSTPLLTMCNPGIIAERDARASTSVAL